MNQHPNAPRAPSWHRAAVLALATAATIADAGAVALALFGHPAMAQAVNGTRVALVLARAALERRAPR